MEIVPQLLAMFYHPSVLYTPHIISDVDIEPFYPHMQTDAPTKIYHQHLKSVHTCFYIYSHFAQHAEEQSGTVRSYVTHK